MAADQSGKRITVRLSAVEDQNLRLEADGAGMNVSQLIRDRAIGHATRAGCPGVRQFRAKKRDFR